MKFLRGAGVLLLLIGAISAPSPAHSQGFETWSASFGTDNTVCSHSAPCQTMGAAYNVAGSGGIIRCIDRSSFLGTLPTITHSLTIDCRGVSFDLLAIAGNAITVNAGPDDVVI